MILFFYAEFIANGAKINFRPILGSNREQLKELKELKDQKILTDEEYEAKRQVLVDQLGK